MSSCRSAARVFAGRGLLSARRARSAPSTCHAISMRCRRRRCQADRGVRSGRAQARHVQTHVERPALRCQLPGGLSADCQARGSARAGPRWGAGAERDPGSYAGSLRIDSGDSAASPQLPGDGQQLERTPSASARKKSGPSLPVACQGDRCTANRLRRRAAPDRAGVDPGTISATRRPRLSRRSRRASRRCELREVFTSPEQREQSAAVSAAVAPGHLLFQSGSVPKSPASGRR